MKIVAVLLGLALLAGCGGGPCDALRAEFKELAVKSATTPAVMDEASLKQMTDATAGIQRIYVEAQKNDCPMDKITGQTK